MTSPAHVTHDNQANLTAIIVDANDIDTNPGTPTSATSGTCCGIAEELLRSLAIAGLGLLSLGISAGSAVWRDRYSETPQTNFSFSMGIGLGITAGVYAMGVAAYLAKNHFANTAPTNALQTVAPTEIPLTETPLTETPRPQIRYTVVSQPNQEIALAVQTGSPQGHEIL